MLDSQPRGCLHPARAAQSTRGPRADLGREMLGLRGDAKAVAVVSPYDMAAVFHLRQGYGGQVVFDYTVVGGTDSRAMRTVER